MNKLGTVTFGGLSGNRYAFVPQTLGDALQTGSRGILECIARHGRKWL